MNPAHLARLADYDSRAQAAQAKAAQAYARLLRIAETSETGQAHRVARFLASCQDGARWPFDLFELRTVDVEISDDMLACLDALRWAKADLHKLAPEGLARLQSVLVDFGLLPAP